MQYNKVEICGVDTSGLPKLTQKENEELKAQLAAYKASLTKEEIDHIVEETRLLREYQEHEPTEEEPTVPEDDVDLPKVEF